jgi:cell wall-associated NlpC family hydrolase
MDCAYVLSSKAQSMKIRPVFLFTALPLLVLAVGCNTSKKATRYDYLLKDRNRTEGTATSVPAETAEPMAGAGTLSAREVKTLLQTAQGYMGTPYKFGGTTRKGMDCSGLVYTCFLEIKRELPRNSAAMKAKGRTVAEKNIRPGHLVFFSTGAKGKVNHVGLVTSVRGNEVEFIHSSTSNGVRKDKLSDPYWSKRFEGAAAY